MNQTGQRISQIILTEQKDTDEYRAPEMAEKPSVMISEPLCYLCKEKPAGHGDYYRHSAYCEACQTIAYVDPDYRVVESPKGLVPQKILKRAYTKGAAWRPGGRPKAVQIDLMAA